MMGLPQKYLKHTSPEQKGIETPYIIANILAHLEAHQP